MDKVLILAHGFPGHGGRGNIKLIKYLPKFGYEPIILTNRTKKDKFEEKVVNAEFNGRCKYYKTVCMNKTPFRIFSKFFNLKDVTIFLEGIFFIPDIYITWVPSAVLKGLRIIRKEKIKVIITISPPESIHIAGLLLSKISGAKLIVDFEDLWTIRKVAYHPPTFLHDAIIKKIERTIMEKSNHIIANTHGNKKMYIDHFHIPKDKITIITNGYDPVDMSNYGGEISSTDNKVMTIGYMGNFDKHGLPYDKFILAIKGLVNINHNIKMKIIIYGHMSEETRKFITEHKLSEYVDHCGILPHSEAFKAIQKCDLLLLLLIETEYSKSWVPQKLYHYLAMSKPIIAIADEEGEIASIINSTKTGLVISPNKEKKMLETLVKLYNEWEKKGNINYAPNEEEIEKYNFITITKHLSKTIKSVSKQ